MMAFTARPTMVLAENKGRGDKTGADHSIESALIQASSKGYTIDMILGNHDRKPKQEGLYDQDGRLSRNLSDNEGTVIK